MDLLQLTTYFLLNNNIYTHMHTHTHTHTHSIYRGTFLLQAATNGCKPWHYWDRGDFTPCFECCTISKLQQL